MCKMFMSNFLRNNIPKIIIIDRVMQKMDFFGTQCTQHTVCCYIANTLTERADCYPLWPMLLPRL